MTEREFITYATDEFISLYDEREAANLAWLLAEEALGITRVGIVMEPDKQVDISSLLFSMVERIARGEPIQYVMGYTWFAGMKFRVGKSVLIPRPETEELVEWIVTEDDKSDKDSTILDIGTGSGAIAVSLAKRLYGSSVTAMDISADALETARENALLNQVSVRFVKENILELIPVDGCEKYDIIVSNPPYIPASEKATMHTNVILWEPDGALFVPDDDPLIFYRAIAIAGREMLREKGKLFFEIHKDYGKEVFEILSAEGYEDIELRNDLNGRERMIMGIKK